MAEVMTFEAFAARRGAQANFGDAGLHTRIHMSNAAHRRAMKQVMARDAELAERRRVLRTEFEALCNSGAIREPTTEESLMARAFGNPECLSTQAAIRVLAKRQARAALQSEEPAR